MEKAYKFRIYPNKTQIQLFQKTFGCVRKIYNYFLDKRIKAYEEQKATLTYTECSKELTALKIELPYLKEPDKCALQNALKELPKVGKVKFRDKQEIHGRILNATISQKPSGKYFVSICCREVEMAKLEPNDNVVGINLGLKDFIITSAGGKYYNPKYLKRSLQKLAKLQKELSRKTSGGSNWNKNRIKVA